MVTFIRLFHTSATLNMRQPAFFDQKSPERIEPRADKSITSSLQMKAYDS